MLRLSSLIKDTAKWRVMTTLHGRNASVKLRARSVVSGRACGTLPHGRVSVPDYCANDPRNGLEIIEKLNMLPDLHVEQSPDGL